MRFDELMADTIMSHTWKCCGNPHMNGIYITYYCDDSGENVDCGILQPNPNFKYPDVYNELCKRICEEHNKHLQNNTEKERKEP